MTVRRLAGRVPLGEFGRGVLTLVLGTGAAQVIVVVSSPVLTRLYAPSAYGVFAVATSIVSILITMACLRYEFAIPLPEDDVAAANVLALAILINLVMSLTVGVVLWLKGGWLLGLFGASALAPYVLLISLGQLGGGAVSAFSNWAVRTKSFQVIAATRLAQACSLVAVQVGLGIVGLGPPGLLAGDVAGRIAGWSRLARGAWHTHASAFRRVSRAGIATAAQRYRRFPVLSSPSALLYALGMQTPLLLVVAFFGTHTGGQFALADRMCSIPLSLVAGAVGQVYLSEGARLARGEPAALRKLFRRTTRSLAGAALVPAASLAIAAPILAGPVFGSDWAEAGLYVAILAPMYFIAFVVTATGETLYFLERQDLQLVREALRLGLLGGSVLVAAAAGLPPLAAVAALSLGGCLAYVLYGLLSWRALAAHRVAAASSPTLIT